LRVEQLLQGLGLRVKGLGCTVQGTGADLEQHKYGELDDGKLLEAGAYVLGPHLPHMKSGMTDQHE
jgi:hypothetical protein